MIDQPSRAERFTVKRGWWCLGFALVSALWTVVIVSSVNGAGARWPTVAAWVTWMSGTLIWTFGWPAWWKWTPRERQIIRDELTREQQRSVAMLAMTVLMIGLAVGSMGIFGGPAVPSWWPAVTLAAGVCVAGGRFGWLQVYGS